MSDVFLSYARRDRARVEGLASRLRAAGLDVWWDADIRAGAAWEATIEEALAAARVVVVCWSAAAVASENVRAEARRARTDGRLIQLFLDDTHPPLFFGERQGIAISGGHDESGTARLIAVIREVLAGAPAGVLPMASTLPRPGRRMLLIGGGAAIAAAASGGALIWLKSSESGDPSIAVMPFANLSGDPDQAYFSDGIAEELRAALARLPHLKVIARTSSERLRDAPAADAARQLGVANILTGSVRRSPTMIRVIAQLIDGGDGTGRWSQSYDRALGDTLAIQSGIAENVARELSLTLGLAAKAAITLGGTANPVANDLYLQAYRLGITGDEADSRRALGLLDGALALDPRYADATAARASILGFLAGGYAPSAAAAQAGLAEAVQAARRAIAIAPTFARAYATLASLNVIQLEFRPALALYGRALTLGQEASWLLHLSKYAYLLGRLRKDAAAAAVSAKIAAIDPLNPLAISIRVALLAYRRQYPDALAAARILIRLTPTAVDTRYWIGLLLFLLGKPHESLAEARRLPANHASGIALQAILAARLGDRAGSDRMLASLQLNDAANFQQAEVHAQRGEVDLAIAALDRAWQARDPGLSDLLIDALLDPVRADPRFKALVAKLDFP